MKRTLIIIGIGILLLALGLGAAWFSLEQSNTAADDLVPPERTFSPFGFITDIFSSDELAPGTQTESATGTPSVSSRSVYDIFTQQSAYKPTDALVAGAVFVNVQIGTTTDERLRYVERETGHIYDLSLATGVIERISNTTIPRLQEVLFGDNGTLIAFRYLADDGDTIQTYLGKIELDEEGRPNELTGDFLPENLRTIALHPTDSEVFYLLTTSAGSVGRIYDAEANTTRSLFSSPLTEWLASWDAESYIFLSTKPSTGLSGFGYAIDPKNGTTVLVLTNVATLTGLPHDTGDILVGLTRNGKIALGIYGQVSGIVENLAGSTLPEKCAWLDGVRVLCAIPSNAAGSLPDAWYEGSVSFNDSFWTINTETNITEYLFDAETTNEPFDAIHVDTNDDTTVFSFINKKDSRLWIASMTPASNSIFDGDREENF